MTCVTECVSVCVLMHLSPFWQIKSRGRDEDEEEEEGEQEEGEDDGDSASGEHS